MEKIAKRIYRLPREFVYLGVKGDFLFNDLLNVRLKTCLESIFIRKDYLLIRRRKQQEVPMDDIMTLYYYIITTMITESLL